MKLVKNKITQVYSIIKDEDFDDTIYIDRSNNITYWDRNKDLADYVFIRDRIKDAIIAIGGFSELRLDIEKDIVLKYTNSVEPSDLIGYLMGKGLSSEEAQYVYLQYRAEDIRNSSVCYTNRLNQASFTVAIMSYLGQADGEIFLDNCRNFIADLKDTGILGTNYGNTRDGLFDYIEDTGSYDGIGLSNFFNLPDEQDKLDTLIKQLKDIILYGYTT